MKIFTHTHIGKRKSQQDCFRIDADSGLFLVCDGVGGSDEGSFAARWVSDFIYDRRAEITSEENLLQLIVDANTFLNHELKDKLPGKNGHTTIALVKYWNPAAISIVHIGDSRVYKIYNANKQIWHTKDDTLLQQMIDHDILESTDHQIKHPMRHQLTKSIGSGSKIRKNDISSEKFEIHPEDTMLLICTDGVWELLDESIFMENLQKYEIKHFVSSLKYNINLNASDNATFVIIDQRSY